MFSLQTLALFTARGLATLFNLQGNAKAATALDNLANAIESGANVDKHMKEIAEKLNGAIPIDWDEFNARLESEVAAFLDQPPPPDPE